MQYHDVCVHPETARLPRSEQLAWKIAQVAADPVPVDIDVTEMVVNRLIDNASVAVASLNRHSVMSARAEALAHTRNNGATVFGMARYTGTCRMGCMGQRHCRARTRLP